MEVFRKMLRPKRVVPPCQNASLDFGSIIKAVNILLDFSNCNLESGASIESVQSIKSFESNTLSSSRGLTDPSDSVDSIDSIDLSPDMHVRTPLRIVLSLPEYFTR
jgi:hypothetical protein